MSTYMIVHGRNGDAVGVMPSSWDEACAIATECNEKNSDGPWGYFAIESDEEGMATRAFPDLRRRRTEDP